jgi:hypothetical protein
MGFLGIFMSETDFEDDKNFKSMIENFLQEMVTDHGFTFTTATAVVLGELQREYDQRVKSRRASFRVIEGPADDEGRAEG